MSKILKRVGSWRRPGSMLWMMPWCPSRKWLERLRICHYRAWIRYRSDGWQSSWRIRSTHKWRRRLTGLILLFSKSVTQLPRMYVKATLPLLPGTSWDNYAWASAIQFLHTHCKCSWILLCPPLCVSLSALALPEMVLESDKMLIKEETSIPSIVK